MSASATDDAGREAAPLRVAQTYVQLHRQLRDAGYAPADVECCRAAYRLAAELFTARFRPSHDSFLSHVVGTASILTSMRARPALVAAALLHSAYPEGDFGRGAGTPTARARAEVRQALGGEVEALVARYAVFEWSGDRIAELAAQADLGPDERDMVLLRLANALDDYADAAVLHSANAEGRRTHARRNGPALIGLALRLSQPVLARDLERAFDATLREDAIPGAAGAGPVRSYVITPRSLTQRLPVRARAVAGRLQARAVNTQRGIRRASAATQLSPKAGTLPRKAFYRATAPIRLLPDFLVIGAQKAGTTALYELLSEHPWVAPAVAKEVHYFDLRYHRGLTWYRASFPTRLTRVRAAFAGRGLRTGEGSPYYMFHPLVPARVAANLPGARLIALLRDPVDRAWSHYHHNRTIGVRDPVRNGIVGFETESFERAIELEEERLRGEEERMRRDPGYLSFTHLNYGYLARSRYLEQLRRWRAEAPENPLLIVSSAELRHDPAPVLERVLDFLELPSWRPAAWPVSNVGRYPAMPEDLRRRLRDYFAPYNRELELELGREFGWS